jgi:hypothetical protein
MPYVHPEQSDVFEVVSAVQRKKAGAAAIISATSEQCGTAEARKMQNLNARKWRDWQTHQT